MTQHTQDLLTWLTVALGALLVAAAAAPATRRVSGEIRLLQMDRHESRVLLRALLLTAAVVLAILSSLWVAASSA